MDEGPLLKAIDPEKDAAVFTLNLGRLLKKNRVRHALQPA